MRPPKPPKNPDPKIALSNEIRSRYNAGKTTYKYAITRLVAECDMTEERAKQFITL